MLIANPMGFFGLPTNTQTVSVNTNNVNWFTLAGSPAGPVNAILIVNALIGSTSTSNPALDVGTGWAAGSTFTIINSSTIEGMGGQAGNGGRLDVSINGSPGGAGGNAIELRGKTIAYSGSGNAWGGGGGGGGGGGADGCTNGGGGGGGGGAGNAVGGAGAGGPAFGCGVSGSNGTGGTSSAGGTGGAGGNIGCGAVGGTGGTGGTPGVAGDGGANAVGAGTNGSGGDGGAAGKAVNLSGGSINITTNGTTVRGAVS